MRDVYLATMISLATAAFGVVAALAWNAFITELVKQVLGAEGVARPSRRAEREQARDLAGLRGRATDGTHSPRRLDLTAARSPSGLGRLPFKEKVMGSNPIRATERAVIRLSLPSSCREAAVRNAARRREAAKRSGLDPARCSWDLCTL